jgi:hypothetical protein
MERGPGGGGHQVHSRETVPLKRGKISIFMVHTFLLNCTIHFCSPEGVLQWHRFLLLHIVSPTFSILCESGKPFIIYNGHVVHLYFAIFELWCTYLRHFELFFLALWTSESSLQQCYGSGSGSGSAWFRIKLKGRIRIRIRIKAMRIQSSPPVWTRGLDLTITPPLHPSCYGLVWVGAWVHPPFV